VKRFDFDTDEACTRIRFGEMPDGAYVLFEDVNKLIGERDGLKAEIARLRAGGQVTKGELERLEEFKRQVRENRR